VAAAGGGGGGRGGDGGSGGSRSLKQAWLADVSKQPQFRAHNLLGHARTAAKVPVWVCGVLFWGGGVWGCVRPPAWVCVCVGVCVGGWVGALRVCVRGSTTSLTRATLHPPCHHRHTHATHTHTHTNTERGARGACAPVRRARVAADHGSARDSGRAGRAGGSKRGSAPPARLSDRCVRVCVRVCV
jgi:hypothetical protein